jgi:L-seryl-tRNA(Ser) seleniumtransferase
MKRVLRLDKVRLAALESTLRLYIHPDCLSQSLPTLRLLTRPASDIEAQAYRLLKPMRNALSGRADITVMACASQVGSGALPVETLPSFAIALSKVSDGISADALARRLRALPIPVIGRIRSDVLLLDLRCLVDETIFLSQLADLATA